VPVVSQTTLVLQPPDHNPCRDPHLISEIKDISSVEISTTTRETSPELGGYQTIGSEAICLTFLLLIVPINRVNEDFSLSVTKQVPGLVKEREPEMII